MSFSSKIKDELSRQLSPARHCQIAEIAAILSLCGRIQISGDERYSIKIHTENVTVARKCFKKKKKTFNIIRIFPSGKTPTSAKKTGSIRSA